LIQGYANRYILVRAVRLPRLFIFYLGRYQRGVSVQELLLLSLMRELSHIV